MRVRKIGILTGGGDCPGLNAVIRAVVLRADELGMEVMGIRGGWRGFLENDTEKLTADRVREILDEGGTILGTSRVNPFQSKGGPERVHAAFGAWHLDGLVAVGGDGTNALAKLFYERGLPVVGVPKTIDNDITGTEVTFGFDTAVHIAADAIARLSTTAEAHERVMVVEVMGRNAGWIALHAGLAGGADLILIPERPVNLVEVCNKIHYRRAQGKLSSLIVVAEGILMAEHEGGEAKLLLANEAPDAFGRPRLGGAGGYLATRIEQTTGIETRVTVLGHVQRGGTPTARDRVLASQFGVKAVDLCAEDNFGRMAALRDGAIIDISLEEATGSLKTVPAELFGLMDTLTR
jgi:6-phosphofructokinase 1